MLWYSLTTLSAADKITLLHRFLSLAPDSIILQIVPAC